MKVYQHKVLTCNDITHLNISFNPDVFFLFVSHNFPEINTFLSKLNTKYKDAICIGCSTSGEILGNEVLDATISLTAIQFEKTKIKLFSTDFEYHKIEANNYNIGCEISKGIVGEDLQHAFIFSDSLIGNGTQLLKGINSKLNKHVGITGGIAGINGGENTPFVIQNGKIKTKTIVALGLYGSDLKIGIGCRGGWDSFGIERKVTKSKNNVIYELDGLPALDIYKSFLGDKVNELPAASLTFPLSIRNKNNKIPVVRAVIDINEKDSSLIFIGKIEEGSYVRGMKANIDRLINGAEEAAIVCKKHVKNQQELAIIVSCAGRKQVMKQLVDEEVDAVNEVLGSDIYIAGFYSHGEISPFNKFSKPLLHNQTFSLTTLSE